MSDAIYDAIAKRYGFRIPTEYQRLESGGLFAISASGHASAFYQPGSYLWLNDMEWYSPEAILNFQFQPWHLPGFVPFAFTGGGDYWCWHPARAGDQGFHVMCCFLDDRMATVYAPNFHTALYRQILQFCAESSECEDIDAAKFLRRWATDLAGIFPNAWRARLLQLADDPLRAQRAPAIERTDIAFTPVDTEIPWMQL
jgi:hypothetical protein